MAWGRVTIGGVTLREEIVAEDQGGDPARLSIAGQESSPPSTVAEVIAAHHNLVGLQGLTVPVVFTDKEDLSGFYRVVDASSTMLRHAEGAVQAATWRLALDRVGAGRDVEVESRVPSIARQDELAGAQTPVFWHAPAVGVTSYWTGPTVPSGSITRTSADGDVTVHTGLPADVSPRWTVPTEDYLAGSARILIDGVRRVGERTPDHTWWRMHNGLVQVAREPDGRIAVSAWDDDDWRSDGVHEFRVAGVALDDRPELTILRNEPEECAIRLTYPAAAGLVTVDLSLRRGSRFVAGTVRRHAAADLAVARAAGSDTAATAVTGGIVETTADADGNRYVIGSPSTVTAAPSSLTRASSTSFPFFLGHEIGGTPQAGDAFADLLVQYLGSSGERARIVRR